MSRASLAAFAALVLATVAAFFVTQHLKSTTPVIGANITPPSPLSPHQRGCRQTHTSFYLLHRADDVSVYVIDSGGDIIRTIAVGRHMPRGQRIAYYWNGREDNGLPAPDGTYYFRVGLIHQGRTIDLTDYPILLKTVAPHPVVTNVSPSLLPVSGGAQVTFTGTGGRVVAIRIYRTDTPGPPRLVRSFLAKGSPTRWDGEIGGRPAPPGTYLVGLEVTDRACNTGRFPAVLPPPPDSTAHAGVTVRYLGAQPPLDPVLAGAKAVVLVDSRQRPYQWALRRLGARRTIATGAGTRFELRVPLPRGAAGLYELAIRSGPYRTEVPLITAAPAGRRSVLVVLPALTWQGENVADDNGDGLPDTLEDGGPIDLDRVLVAGLPAGFGAEAAFLAYLDRAHLSYDLTTDLGLVDRVGPSLAGHSGVVLAGSERWIPNSLAAALRSYTRAGGRVLSWGVDSLRRGVSIQPGAQGPRAISPTAPGATDALDARPGALVTHNTDQIIVIRDGLGIFAGTSEDFSGFDSYQSILGTIPPAGPIRSAAGASDASPTIVGYRLGDGIVIEAGLPDLGASLTHSVDAQELIRRLWTILSR